MGDFELSFVDSIAVDPDVRLDVNDGVIWKTTAGTEFGMPQLRRAVSATMLADGDHISAAVYGNRLLTLHLDMSLVTDRDVAAAELQKLARELNRPSNLLRYRPATTHPVWFRTFRADFDQIIWDAVLQRYIVKIPAAPFAAGLPETLPTVTVTNDPNPGASANPMFWDVAGVKGDVDALTLIRWTPFAGFSEDSAMVAVRRRGAPSNLQHVQQAESATQGIDTATFADAVMSGGNGSRVTFDTNTDMVTRLIFDWPAVPSVDARGVYRVLARIRKSNPLDVIDMRVTVNNTDAQTLFVTDTVRLPETPATVHVDLGLISMPSGADPVYDGPSGVELVPAAYEIWIDAQLVSGTGDLDLDYVLFVPADDQVLSVKTREVGSPPAVVVDSVHDMVYGISVTDEVLSSVPITTMGDTPTLRPGVTNRLYLISGIGAGVVASLVSTADLAITYWPQYMYVRPVAS